MAWLLMEFGARSRLNDTSRIHNRDLISDFQQQREVMRNEDDRKIQAVAQLHDLSQDFTLHHDIKGCCRFIHDDQFWRECQGNGNDGPLAHPTTQLMRIAFDTVGRDAYETKQINGTFTPCVCTHFRSMRAQHICNLRTNIQHRIERVHSTLEDNGELLPAKFTEFRRAKSKNVHRL